MDAGSAAPANARIRQDRDRFVAFAFAAADAFFEVDIHGRIMYATGALRWLAGADNDDFIDRDLLFCLDNNDRRVVQAAFKSAPKQGRIGPLNVKFRREGGDMLGIALSGTYLPKGEGRIYVAVNGRSMSAGSQTSSQAIVEKSTPEQFADLVGSLAEAAKASGQDLSMTLIQLANEAAVRDKLGDKADDFIANLQAHMKSHSIDGNAVEEVGDGTYGIVHRSDVNVKALQEELASVAEEAGTTAEELGISSSTIDVTGSGLSAAEQAKALVFTIQKFAETRGEFTIDDLSNSYKDMLAEAQTRVADFKRVIKFGAFDFAYQPIVRLDDRSLHHFEALVRFRDDKPGASPFETITFAEEIGIISEFDLAVVQKAMAEVKAARAKKQMLNVAINVSGRSLEEESFTNEFLSLLRKHHELREQIMFEITESWRIDNLEATSNFLKAVRKAGHHVCLDDFGAGASAFQYLRALEVDFVKIDGEYVRDAASKPNGKAFLRSISTLCADLKMKTVGEMVETEEDDALLREVGVDFGQGYLYGKPAMKPAARQG
jgi:EAL domain-containing protein (putative c-di-GMP-specific phosphodiesterase class I)